MSTKTQLFLWKLKLYVWFFKSQQAIKKDVRLGVGKTAVTNWENK